MKVISADGPWRLDGRKVCAAIGVFDGVHLGHQRILRQISDDARACGGLAAVVTFDRHPNEVVAPRRTPSLLYQYSKKMRVLESLGLDLARVIHFDKALSQLSAEEFIRKLVAEAGRLESVCVGEGFTFGCRRHGNVALLRELGATVGFALHAAPPIMLDGEAVSSTRVRQAVSSGDFALAARLLGRPYELSAVVLRGAQLGRKLGFPTANLAVAGLVTPPNGVYAADAQIDGVQRRAAVNIGLRPTLGAASGLAVEAHLLDFEGDLYGAELELVFLRKLREEQKFPSLETLREQVERDIAQARKL
jgi:riboflavin kinase/FMN adenylyltransferase